MRNKNLFLQIILSSLTVAVFSAAAFFQSVKTGVCTLCIGIVLLLVFLFTTKKRFDEIKKLNDYLSAVLRGDYSFNIQNNEEGELSILSNNIFKVVSRLKSKNEKIEKDKIALSKSLADISHRLKTPLTAMCVSTDILKSRHKNDDDTKFVSIIENESEKMTWLVTTLLKLSKLDAGTIEMNFEKHSANKIVSESVAPFLLLLDLKEITLETIDADFEINCDKNWLCEAIQNIIKNSIEHTNPGGKITISTRETPLFCEIAISDNGNGIDENDLPHIFERFFKSKNSNADSVGIGLALSNEIVHAQSGKIDVQSEIGKGTSFSVKLYKVATI